MIFNIKKISFISEGDIIKQYYPFFKYIRNVWVNFFSSGKFPVYDIKLGFGSDVMGAMTHYGLFDPIIIASVFVKEKFIYVYFVGSLFFRLYLCGITSIYAYKYFGHKNNIVLLSTAVYILNGATFYYFLFQPQLIYMVIFFPLYIVGIYEVINQNKYNKFILFTFLCTLQNYYSSCMLYILTIVFCIIYIIYKKCDKTKTIRVIFAIVLAVAIESIIIIPMFLTTAASNKTFFGLEKIFEICSPACIVFPLYTSYSSVAIPAITFIIIILTRKKKIIPDIVKLFFYIGIIAYCFLPLSWILNVGMYTIQRWAYVLAFISGYILLYLPQTITSLNIKNNTKKYLIRLLPIIIILIQLFKLFFIFTINNQNYNRFFLSKEKEKQYEQEYNKQKIIEDDGLRKDGTSIFETYNDYLGRPNQNIQLFASNNFYCNSLNKYIYQQISDIGNTGISNIVEIDNFDNDTILSKIWSVDTYYSDNEINIPYNYIKQQDNIYKDEDNLPLMYAYYNTVNYEQFDALNKIEKRMVYMRAAVTENENNHNILNEINNDVITLLPKSIKTKNIDIKDNTYNFLNNDSVLSFDITPQKGETFVCFSVKITPNIVRCPIVIFDDVEKVYDMTGFSYTYYEKENDYMNIVFRLGDLTKFKKDKIQCRIQLFRNDVNVRGNSKDNIIKDLSINAIPENYLITDNTYIEKGESISFTENKATGIINTKKEAVGVLSVPYQKGWQIKVNGKEVDPIRVNTAFLGFKLQKGENHIECIYINKYPVYGLILTCIGILIYLLFLIITRRKSQNKL